MVHIMKEKCIGIMICFLLTAIVLPVSGSESYGQYGGVNSIINAGDKLMEPPSIPIVSGPVVAGPGISLNFSCVSKTSNETKLYYLWDWGDGNFSEWIGSFDSGEPMFINYSWDETGTYEIRLKAKDNQDNESDWSEPHNISIASQITFSNIQLGYVYLNIFPENNPYGHSNLLELFGAIIMVSREYDLVLNATVTEAVHYVVFEAINILRGDNTSCDDTNVSNGVSGVLTISRGLWQLSAYAYDENETLIDYDRIEFFLYLVFGSGGSSVEYIDMIRQRLLDRILA
jgi:hypothetical protein